MVREEEGYQGDLTFLVRKEIMKCPVLTMAESSQHTSFEQEEFVALL